MLVVIKKLAQSIAFVFLAYLEQSLDFKAYLSGEIEKFLENFITK